MATNNNKFKIYDLDNVLITEGVKQSWLFYVKEAVEKLNKKYIDLQSSEIPDEKFKVYENGTAEIYIYIYIYILK